MDAFEEEIIESSVPLSDDEREALAEIVARAIRAGRYSGKMVATPQPREWHNPVDLRDGRRAVDAILASDVWRNRRQGPITKSAALKGYYTIPEQQRKRLTFESWLAALEATERARSATTEPVERKERA